MLEVILPPLLGLSWFLFSYILTDPALNYSTSPLFLTFQNFLWQFSSNRPLLTALYVIIIACFFLVYFLALKRPTRIPLRSFLIFIFFLIISNPALSYDLFNYMFDAKLVVHYHLDPHTTAAFAFMDKEPWTRFMRNVFFPTTYGYAWTVLSLVPYILGFGKFLLVFLGFKFYAAFFLYLLYRLHKYLGARAQDLVIFFLSPLVLLETLSSGHNDIFMMTLAFSSFALLIKSKGKGSKLILPSLLSLVLLLISALIKRSTILLLPVWLFLALRPLLPKQKIYQRLYPYWADFSSLLIFIPLLTPLSRFFHPWYLLWSLSFLPFIKNRFWRLTLIVFSLTSMLRYLPILYFNSYSDWVENIQHYITFSALPIALLIFVALKLKRKPR